MFVSFAPGAFQHELSFLALATGTLDSFHCFVSRGWIKAFFQWLPCVIMMTAREFLGSQIDCHAHNIQHGKARPSGKVLTPSQGKRVFIKDITHYLLPPNHQEARLAPSLQTIKRGVGTNNASLNGGVGSDKDAAADTDSGVGFTPSNSRPESPNSPSKAAPFPYENSKTEGKNPTVVPRDILEKFHFTFLIRHPRSAIPSYYRCCIPPLVERTQFTPFMPEEAGYDELRRLFDYLKDEGIVGPKVAGRDGELKEGQVEICVIDADDMLDDPEGILRQYCDSIGLDFSQAMLQWDSEESHAFAKEQFEKWNGFHDDAINSTDLKPRAHVSSRPVAARSALHTD